MANTRTVSSVASAELTGKCSPATFSRVTKDAFHGFGANLAESENDRDDGFRTHSTRPLAQTIA